MREDIINKMSAEVFNLHVELLKFSNATFVEDVWSGLGADAAKQEVEKTISYSAQLKEALDSFKKDFLNAKRYDELDAEKDNLKSQLYNISSLGGTVPHEGKAQEVANLKVAINKIEQEQEKIKTELAGDSFFPNGVEYDLKMNTTDKRIITTNPVQKA